jgi:hypothetical protein
MKAPEKVSQALALQAIPSGEEKILSTQNATHQEIAGLISNLYRVV